MRSIVISLFSVSILLSACQKEASPDGIAGDTRDSLVGRWDNIYTFTKDYSDSSFRMITDSSYQGHNAPFSFLQLNNDSTYRLFFSSNPAPPIYGYGYSGRWRFDALARRLHVSTERWSQDTGWVSTGVQPPPNGILPFDFIAYLDTDSMVLYRQYIHRPPVAYRYWRLFDVYKRRR